MLRLSFLTAFMLSLIFSTGPLFASELTTSSPKWVATKNKHCAEACSDIGLMPVKSDSHITDGHGFFVCAANIKSEGYRSGYNVGGKEKPRCFVQQGINSNPQINYHCLCSPARIIPISEQIKKAQD
ncbi:hypothetical protein SAMN02745165_03272 [Malonomonas rubra DSM 5091]|uniref:CVNH domain-containing protein n=1 Tax=Malonomonas rubra DSM 5091 TaxID=1122189 RepID=A0A1M6MGV3_MALRU|nr:hypothetical protein [Malonomonas rubra]SHJ82553.1 hypothetical protein SAMN02745165_03272 [Malonomonas rubra DSM 5091]